MTADLPVRVMVPDAWDEVALRLPPEATMAELKQQALAAVRAVAPAAGYEVKFRGGVVADAQTLAGAGAVPNAAFIVLARRRRPVR